MQELRDKREALHIKLLELEAELSARYGVAAGQVFDLQTIQAQLAADAALLSWVTAETFSERWACIVRSTGLPIWVKLSGTGPSGAWSKDDTARWQKAPREWGGRPDD